MIVDNREIQFEAEGLLTVLAGSPKTAAILGLPPGLPQAVLFEPKIDSVRFVFPGSGRAHSVSLDAPRLAALLVGFCMRLGIPLPRRAEKVIRVEPGMVILAFRTTMKPNLSKLVPEGRQTEGEPASQRSWSQTG